MRNKIRPIRWPAAVSSSKLSVASNVRTAFKNMKNVCTQRASRIVPFSRSKITKQPYSGNNYRVEGLSKQRYAQISTNMT